MSIWLEPETKAEIERLAHLIGITPSRFCRNLVTMGLDEAKMLEKVGVLQMAIFFEALRQRIREKVGHESERMSGFAKDDVWNGVLDDGGGTEYKDE